MRAAIYARVLLVLLCLLALATSAHAACGWYLFRPYRSDNDRPLRQWSQVAAMDSAAECESSLLRMQERADKFKQPEDMTTADFKRYKDSWLGAICVSSDDPRLK